MMKENFVMDEVTEVVLLEGSLDSGATLLQELEILARSHDWFYDYSDDHSVWKRGFDAQRVIDSKVYYCKEAGLYKEAIDILSKYWNN